MFERISYISNEGCNILLKEGAEMAQNLMNLQNGLKIKKPQ